MVKRVQKPTIEGAAIEIGAAITDVDGVGKRGGTLLRLPRPRTHSRPQTPTGKCVLQGH